MKSALKSDGHIIRDPDLNSSETLPAGWQDYGEQKGLAEPEIWPLWKRFKTVTRWPFERSRWFAYIDKVISNRADQRQL
jgi:hypothetical protein